MSSPVKKDRIKAQVILDPFAESNRQNLINENSVWATSHSWTTSNGVSFLLKAGSKVQALSSVQEGEGLYRKASELSLRRKYR